MDQILPVEYSTNEYTLLIRIDWVRMAARRGARKTELFNSLRKFTSRENVSSGGKRFVL
jgi:hypothetical protein